MSEHCPTCTCGCTCGYGGQHEPENELCAINLMRALAERRTDEEFMRRIAESVRINQRLLERLAPSLCRPPVCNRPRGHEGIHIGGDVSPEELKGL